MTHSIDWKALSLTLLLVVVFRETAVALMRLLGHPELGNLVALFTLLACAFTASD